MSEKIKGITLEIGGDLSGLKKAINGVNSDLKSMQSELRGVDSLLKLDPGNVDLLNQKQELLNRSISETDEKLKALQQVKAQADADMAAGTEVNEKQYRNLVRELASTENKLQELQSEAKEFGSVAKQQAKVAAEAYKDLGKKVGAVGDKLVDIGKKGAVATGAIIAGGAAAFSAASDLEESTNKVQVAFGDASAEVMAFAEEALQGYGLAKGAALDAAATFGDMGTSMGLTQKEAAVMATKLTGLAGDLSSFKNIDVDQAISALNGVFTGETESLKSLGVVMTQTNLDAFALANGFGKTTKEMSEAEKVMLRYEYIMSATENAQGDFARTSDGAANSLRIFTQSTQELTAEFGEVLLPVITPIIQKLTEFVQWLGSLDEGSKKLIVTILGIVAAVGPLLILIGKMATGIGAIIEILPALKAGISAVNEVMKKNPIGIIITLAAALIGYLIHLYQTNEDFRTKVQAAWAKLKDIFGALFEWFKQKVDAIKGIISGLIQKFRDIVTAIVEIRNTIKQKLGEFFEIGVDIVKGIWEGIKNTSKWLLDKIKEWCGSILQGIKDFFGIKSPSLVMRKEVGRMIPLGMAKGIKDTAPEVYRVAKKINQNLLACEEELVKKLKQADLTEATKNMLKIQLSRVRSMRTEYENTMKEIERAQTSMADKLREYGELFTRTQEDGKEFFELGDLQAQIDQINAYSEALRELQARGVSDSLFDEIAEMDVDDALEYSRRLLRQTDEEFDKYLQLWEEKQAAAAQIASSFFGADPEIGMSVNAGSLAEAISTLNGNANIAVAAVQEDKTELLNEIASATAQYIGQVLLDGLAGIQDTILSAMPDKLVLNMNGRQVANATWFDFESLADLRGRLFAPSRQTIASIAASVVSAAK